MPGVAVKGQSAPRVRKKRVCRRWVAGARAGPRFSVMAGCSPCSALANPSCGGIFNIAARFFLGCLVCFRFSSMTCMIVLHVSEEFGVPGSSFVYNDHRFSSRSLYVGAASRYGRVTQFSTARGLDKLCVPGIQGRTAKFRTDEGTEERRESRITVRQSCVLCIHSLKFIESIR